MGFVKGFLFGSRDAPQVVKGRVNTRVELCRVFDWRFYPRRVVHGVDDAGHPLQRHPTIRAVRAVIGY